MAAPISNNTVEIIPSKYNYILFCNINYFAIEKLYWISDK